jgi:hypothetical protein
MQDPDGFEYLSRLCLLKNRLYQIIVMAPRGRMTWAQGPKFLGSFKLAKG